MQKAGIDRTSGYDGPIEGDAQSAIAVVGKPMGLCILPAMMHFFGDPD